MSTTTARRAPLVAARPRRPTYAMDRGTAVRVTLAAGEAAVAIAFGLMAYRCWTEAADLWSDGELFRKFVAWATLPANTTAAVVAALPKGGAIGSGLRMAASLPVGTVAALLAYGTCEGMAATVRRLTQTTRQAG